MKKKIKFDAPKVIYVGKVEELTGEGGKNNKDGYGYTILADR